MVQDFQAGPGLQVVLGLLMVPDLQVVLDLQMALGLAPGLWGYRTACLQVEEVAGKDLSEKETRTKDEG